MGHNNRFPHPDKKKKFLKTNQHLWDELRGKFEGRTGHIKIKGKTKYNAVTQAREAGLYAASTANSDVFKSLAKHLREMETQ